MVDSRIEGILLQGDAAGALIVRLIGRCGLIREREKMDQLLSLRREQARRNYISGKRCAVGRGDAARGVVDVDPQIIEIAGALCGCRNPNQLASAGAAPRALIVAEVEQLVLLDRTAQRGAELIP